MTRLVNSHRDKILDSVINAKFKPLADALYDRRAALAVKCYHDIYPAKMLDEMERLPSGWLPKEDHLNYTFGTSHVTLTFSGWRRYDFNVEPWARPDIYRIICAKSAHGQVATYDANHPLTEEYDAIQHAYNDLKQQIVQARKLTAASLEKFYTVEKLLEAWPEIEHHVMTTEPDIIKKNLPAIPLMELNTLLDLPTEVANA